MGVIGGQDGPTAIFVSGSPMGAVLLLAAAVLLVALGIWFFRRRKRK